MSLLNSLNLLLEELEDFSNNVNFDSLFRGDTSLL